MKRMTVLGLIGLWACGADTGGNSPDVEIDAAASDEQELFLDPTRTMFIVAHQDDDFNAFNPTVSRTVNATSFIQSVVLTDGDGGWTTSDCNYVQNREIGQQKVWATMAGKPATTVWTWSTYVVNGHNLRKASLPGTNISIVYMSLRNDSNRDLENLWKNNVASIPTMAAETRVSPQESYTRATLIETLRQLIVNFTPAQINTMDSGGFQMNDPPFEHTDHVFGAMFALSAMQRYTGTYKWRSYRTYNMLFEDGNVSTADTATRASYFNALYSPLDPKVCLPGQTQVTICHTSGIACDDPGMVYNGFWSRQFPYMAVQNAIGGLKGPGGGCLKATTATVGSTVVLAACDMNSTLQEWNFRSDGTVTQKSSGLCLAAVGATRGAGLTLRTCVAGQFDQKFTWTTQQQLRGPDATCVTNAGGALSIQECTANSNQRPFQVQFYPGVFTAATSNFTDTEVPNNAAYYNSFRLADVDADGDADACVRRAGGVYCSMYSPATKTFSSTATLMVSAFRDADGYGVAGRGDTLQFGDITGDGKADVCARGADGIYCGHSTGTTFSAPTKRSAGTDFITNYTTADKFLSIRLVDVNGDGKADICGRRSTGIECALNTGTGTFAAATNWISTEFTDALGWGSQTNGSTIQFGDVDGDGKKDVCGRSSLAILCATNNGASKFTNSHNWGYTGDFNDLQGWGSAYASYMSIRLADVNGDGRADICGRSMNGIMCGLSVGESFAQAAVMIAVQPFTNADGFGADNYGSNPAFGDLDLDGHMDVCMRGPTAFMGPVGLRCAYAP
jgi:LmbE family N-acetylglucosaminyl deacetylase